ncbi:MAG TPA: histidine kinase [Ilumatobacteraceae bacterium]|nr:histidine kinase [Ilumatobacteraceae bacterium]
MIESAGLQRTTLAELRSQFRTEQIASWIAAAGVVVLALAFDEPWGVLLGVGVGVMAILRLPSFAAVDRNDVAGAMWWEAAGTWGIALIVVGVIPDATPIMVLNLIGPLVTGAVYLDARQMRRLISAGVVVAVALGALGFRSEGTGIEDAIPEWLFQVIMVVYLALHVIVTSASLSAANRVRLATIEAVVAANEALISAGSDLRESRRRVISAGDRERVRIERNIHDGAQQRLVAIAVQLQLASQLARSGTPVTPEQLDAMHVESREALEELRELARGIYPSVLTERGLEDALRSVGRRTPNPVEVAYDSTQELSPEDAAAIYFVCLEALQNVAKHAGPQATARVHVDGRGGALIVSISDDGSGCDAAAIGDSRGVLNMADRAGALGGELTVESAPGGGTQVTMVLPHRTAANVGS